jgi:predicted Rossmann-fold nucleotide-binding protein
MDELFEIMTLMQLKKLGSYGFSFVDYWSRSTKSSADVLTLQSPIAPLCISQG